MKIMSWVCTFLAEMDYQVSVTVMADIQWKQVFTPWNAWMNDCSTPEPVGCRRDAQFHRWRFSLKIGGSTSEVQNSL